MISITILSIWENFLRKSLESINSQTYDNYEIIVVNRTGDKKISYLTEEFGAKEIKAKGESPLQSRYLGALESKGSYVFQLEDTKALLRNDALDILNNQKADAIIINQIQDEKTFINKATNIYNSYYFNEIGYSLEIPFIIPRYYKREILLYGLTVVKEKLGDLFNYIVAPEDRLIYTEARTKIKNIYLEKKPLIIHYGEYTLKNVIKKYYYYGKSEALLLNTEYRKYTGINFYERFRNIRSQKNLYYFILANSITVIRGIPFFLGFLNGKNKIKKLGYYNISQEYLQTK